MNWVLLQTHCKSAKYMVLYVILGLNVKIHEKVESSLSLFFLFLSHVTNKLVLRPPQRVTKPSF